MANTASGREHHLQHVHYFRKRITYLDAGTTVEVGTLPPGAVVVDAYAVVTTTFNGNSTNTVDLGINGSGTDEDDFATDLALGTAGIIRADEIATANDFYSATASRLITAGVVSTAGPGQGEAFIVVLYIPNNDR